MLAGMEEMMRYLRNNIFIYAFFILFSSALYTDLGAEISAVNSYASLTCLEEAVKLYREGDFKKAFLHAQLGSTYAPAVADFPYLQALCGKRAGFPFEDCLSNAESTFASGMKWQRYTEEDAKLLCAELNLKMLNYDEALRLIESIKFHNADSDFITASALYGLKKTEKAERIISQSLDKYGFEPRFIKLFFLQERGIKQNLFAKDLSKKILSILYLWKNDYSELLPLAAAFEHNSFVNVHNLKMYRVMHLPFSKTENIEDIYFRSDAILACLHHGIIDEDTAVDEFFDLSTFFTEPISKEKILIPAVFKTHLTELCSMVGSPKIRERIKEILKNYSGVVAEDANKDGILESKIFYRNGRPFSAVFDPFQRGYPRFIVECNFGIPKSITGKNSEYKILFDEYPFASSFLKKDTAYVFRPLALKWQPILLEELNLMLFSKKEKNNSFFILKARPEARELTEQSLVYYALYSEKSIAEKNESEKIFFDKGIPFLAGKRADGMLISVTNYKNGIPAIEKADSDADGYFEVIKKFDEKGSVISISVDLNKDKSFAYNEFYLKNGSVRKVWSGNGKDEIVYFESVSGSSFTEWLHPITKEKVSVKYEFGEPYTLSIGKTSVKILKDGKSSVYWIKKMPDISEKISSEIFRDFNRSTIPLVSLMLDTVNGRVFAVKSGGVIFAEFIDE